MDIIPIAREIHHILAVNTPIRIGRPRPSSVIDIIETNHNLLVLLSEGAGNRILIGSKAPQSFAARDVDTKADTIALRGHGFTTGDGPYRVSSTGALPEGLSSSVDYHVICVSPNAFRLAASRAQALCDMSLDITTKGTRTHTITGIQNAAFPPRKSVTNGSGGLLLSAGQSLVVPAPDCFTVVGEAGAVLTYFFLDRYPT